MLSRPTLGVTKYCLQHAPARCSVITVKSRRIPNQTENFPRIYDNLDILDEGMWTLHLIFFLWYFCRLCGVFGSFVLHVHYWYYVRIFCFHYIYQYLSLVLMHVLFMIFSRIRQWQELDFPTFLLISSELLWKNIMHWKLVI